MSKVTFYVEQQLQKTYIHVSYPLLGIGLKILDVQILYIKIDPDNGESIAHVIFILHHIIPHLDLEFHHIKIKLDESDLEHLSIKFNETEETISVFFTEKSINNKYILTHCNYLDQAEKLVDPNIRFICIAEPIR